MTPVRLEPAALRSRVKHSTTEPLRSLLYLPTDPKNIADVTGNKIFFSFGIDTNTQSLKYTIEMHNYFVCLV